MACKVDPYKRDQRCRKEKTEVAEPDVNGFEMPDAKLARMEPLLVLIRRRSGLRHTAIITR